MRRWINIAANAAPKNTGNIAKPRATVPNTALKQHTPIKPTIRGSLADQRAQPVTIYEAAAITDRKADLALTFSALSALIYCGSMVNLMMSWTELPGELKTAQTDEKVKKIVMERGKKWIIIGSTLFGSISVALGAYFMKSRYILQMKAVAWDTAQPVIEVTTTGLWSSKNAVFRVPVGQFRPLGGGGIDRFRSEKYIKFRDYRYPLAYYYMAPKKSVVKDLTTMNQLFFASAK